MEDDRLNGSNKEKKLASLDYEQWARELFPLTLSPEEYAARESHNFMCFSFDEYCYRDKQLDQWIQRFAEILHTPGRCDRDRRQYLTPEEYEQVQRRMEEEF
jgi:hypothetical protein